MNEAIEAVAAIAFLLVGLAFFSATMTDLRRGQERSETRAFKMQRQDRRDMMEEAREFGYEGSRLQALAQKRSRK